MLLRVNIKLQLPCLVQLLHLDHCGHTVNNGFYVKLAQLLIKRGHGEVGGARRKEGGAKEGGGG